MEQDLKTNPTVTASPKRAEEESANGTTSRTRSVSQQKHQEIKRKVLALHDGLLRRLAEHDRQR